MLTLFHPFHVLSFLSLVKGFSFSFLFVDFLLGLLDMTSWALVPDILLPLLSESLLGVDGSGKSLDGGGVEDLSLTDGGGGDDGGGGFLLSDGCFHGGPLGVTDPGAGASKPDVLAACLEE